MRGLATTIGVSAMLLAAPVTAETPPTKGGVYVAIVPQSRADRPGDRYSFTAVTTEKATANGQTRETGDRQSFDVTILAVGKTGLTLSYTQTGGEVTGADPVGTAILNAWNGLPVVYETDPSSGPLRLVDRPKVVADFLAALAKQPGVTAPFVDAVKQRLDKMSDQELGQQAVGDKLETLSGMQLRGVLQPGRQELPPEERMRPDGGKLLVRRTLDGQAFGEAGPCTVTLARKSWTDNKDVDEPHSSLETTATASSFDGWVLDLTETSTLTSPKGDASRIKTVKIHRDSSSTCGKG